MLPFHAALAASPPHSNGYLQVFLDGGLNQQRIGVSLACQDRTVHAWPHFSKGQHLLLDVILLFSL